MADNETIADIIAEMRGMGNYQRYSGDHARVLANRLDAAWKRDAKELRVEIERLKEERNYSGVRERERLRANGFAIVPKEQLERGDCAKLREALEILRELLGDLLHLKEAEYHNDFLNFCDIIDAALAAPPRNCDKYENAKDAWFAFDALQSKKGAKWHWTEYADWLFAPAQEGGANG